MKAEPVTAAPPTNGRGSASRNALVEVAKIVAVALIYYGVARLSLQFALVQRNVTPLWPPTGIALVVFLVLGLRMWPAIALGALFVNLPITDTVLAAAVTAAGNTLAPLAGAVLLERTGFRRSLDRPRDALSLVILAALLAMTISATVGSATLVASGAVEGRHFLSTWGVWWTGDAMGVLVVAPFLLSLLSVPWPRRTGAARWIEAAALMAVVAAVSLALTQTRLSLMFLILPLIGWAAWRFQLRGSSTATLIASAVATVAVAHGAGPLARATLLERMLALQAFNATIAFTSVLFAALVAERLESRAKLEAASRELEDRVLQRTAELRHTNDRLTQEIADRRVVERMLQRQEQQLVEALDIAKLGSWEWTMASNRVTWSDQMFLIHGYPPRAFDVTFDRAMEQVADEDRATIQHNLVAALAQGVSHELAPVQYRIALPDGRRRILIGKAKLWVDPDGTPARMVGTVQDVTVEREARRDKQIAQALQRSLLPRDLPTIPGFELAGLSRPSGNLQVSGDFYDVFLRPEGLFGLVIGDVSGRGPEAAAVMGIARQTVRVAGMTEPRPSSILRLLNEALLTDGMDLFCTVVNIRVRPMPDGSARLTVCSAGHPLPVILRHDGGLERVGASGTLLGALPDPRLVDTPGDLSPGDTLVMFTDGLIGAWSDAIEHPALPSVLRACVGMSARQVVDALAEWCDREGAADDVALLVVQATRRD